MSASLVVVRDPFHPMRHRELRTIAPEVIDQGATVADMVPAMDAPHVVAVNGQWLLRKDWQRPVRAGDVLAVAVLPQGGGGGSNPLRVVLMIGLAMVAGPLSQALVMGSMVGAPTAGMIATMSVVKAGIVLAGGALINALIPPPKPPSPQRAQALAAPSPTYNLQAQGNMARLGQAIPVQYGRMIAYPDFAAEPYAEYVGNEQFLYQLLCLGQGEFDIEDIRIEDTSITSWEEITYEVIPPGGSVTLFPANVDTSAEVSQQDLPTSTAVGPYVANAAGTQANYLGVDLVAPRGLYYANDAGGLNAVSVQFKVEAREIDNAGTPIGSWVELGRETISSATTTPQRISRRYAVAPGRYEVQITRLDTEETDSRYGHDLVWTSLRAYMPEANDFGNVTLIALRMKATGQLSAQASRKINVISTSKVRTWHPVDGWSGLTATRSIAWAIADACTASYGGKLLDDQVYLQGLYDLDQTWAARGDKFDARFENQLTFWEALQQIATAGRAKPYMQGGVLYTRRDEAQTVPVQMFSMRNIVRGSFNVEYLMPTEESADAVEMSYFDGDVWAERTVLCSLPGSAEANPAKADLFGVTQRDQAHREGVYQKASDKYRRKIITFATEMEGGIPSMGDLITIAHDMPQWGQTGEVVGWDLSSLTLTLSEPVTFEPGETHYVGLRQRNGGVSGPHEVTAGADDYHIVLAANPGMTPYTGQGEERTHFAFGWGETWSQKAILLTAVPRSLNEVQITCINEDPAVHTADQGVIAPAVNSSQLTTLYTAPVLAGLVARSLPDDPTRMLLSWQPAPGADHYLVEQSQDGVSWTRTGDTTAANFSAKAVYGAETLLRVAAVGLTRGPWVQIAYGDAAAYMWVDDAAPMWTTDTNPMWRY